MRTCYPGVVTSDSSAGAPSGLCDLTPRTYQSTEHVGNIYREVVVSCTSDSRLTSDIAYERSDTGVQLAGRDPYWIAEAARMVEANGARFIDIKVPPPD